MTIPPITLDVPTLKLGISILGGLLLLSMIRILFLLKTNNRLRESTRRMEKQVLTQHNEILSVKSDSNAWRGELQRMFDAFRAEFSMRLIESEQRYQDIQNRSVPAKTSVPITEPPSSSSESCVPPVPEVAVSTPQKEAHS